jgi:WD40 repeat protein
MNQKKHNPPAHSLEDFHLRITAAHRTDRFNSVAFSPDGRFIASGSYDNTVPIWSVICIRPASCTWPGPDRSALSRPIARRQPHGFTT